MGINVKRDSQVLTHLNVKLLDTILSEDTEHTLSGILPGNLNDIVL